MAKDISAETPCITEQAPKKLFDLILKNDSEIKDQPDSEQSAYLVLVPSTSSLVLYVLLVAGRYVGCIHDGAYTGFANEETILPHPVTDLIPTIAYCTPPIESRELIEYLDRDIHPHAQAVLERKADLEFTRIATGQQLKQRCTSEQLFTTPTPALEMFRRQCRIPKNTLG